MITEQFLQVPEAYYGAVFKWVWRIVIPVALCFGISAGIWPQYTMPLLAVPCVAATIAGLILGWIGAGGPADEVTRDFSSNFWLRLQASDSGNDVDIFEAMVPDATDRRKVHRLRSAAGGEIFLINAERFKELLVDRLLADAEKATEHALGLAWQKCCGELRRDLDPLLSKTFREAFIQDLNGNVVTLLSRVGDKLIEELRAQTEPPTQSEESFELIPLTATEGPLASKRPPRGKKPK